MARPRPGRVCAALAAAYDIDAVREARPRVVDGEHDAATGTGSDPQRQADALGRVGEDVVEEYVDERDQVRLAGVDRGLRAARHVEREGPPLVLGERRPERGTVGQHGERGRAGHQPLALGAAGLADDVVDHDLQPVEVLGEPVLVVAGGEGVDPEPQ